MVRGGTGVTSMNPVSKELWEEGLAVESFRLVSAGKFEEEGVTKLFMEVANRPGCSATRRIDHNITDLQGELPCSADMKQYSQCLSSSGYLRERSGYQSSPSTI
jgi:N-methylhydantoinase B/oxoprolinase/acetone carboxylase alpha subunit